MAAPILLADDWDYPLLDLFWTMLMLFLWIAWFFLLFRIIGDIFRSDDLSGWGKAGWTIFLILLPLIGALVYLIARGGDMARRDVYAAREADEATRNYIQSAVGSAPSTAGELEKLAQLRDRGVLSAAEFETQKAKLLT
jgi:hypothetical protein